MGFHTFGQYEILEVTFVYVVCFVVAVRVSDLAARRLLPTCRPV